MAALDLLLGALLVISSLAGHGGEAAGRSGARTFDTAHLKISTSTSPMSSGKLFLFVDISPKPRMHVYAPGQEGYIGVGLTLDANPAFTSATPQFPRAEKMFFAPLNEMQLVYTKPFRIVQPITVTPDLRKPLRVTGSLRYQACDDKVCFVPQTVGIEWTTASKPEIRPR